jgi:hypothetical protein
MDGRRHGALGRPIWATEWALDGETVDALRLWIENQSGDSEKR